MGLFKGGQIINDYLNIKAQTIGAEEIEAGIYRLPNGMCIYEDKSTTTPNIIQGVCPDKERGWGLKFYNKGATSSIDSFDFDKSVK